MTPDFTGPLHVLALTDAGVNCAIASPNGQQSFWLPRGDHVLWASPPTAGQTINAVVPGWFAVKHRQLAGDVAYELERVRSIAKTKEQEMTDRPADAGTGALFKNDKKEKPSHPDYRGDCAIHGKKFWMSAWIKEGAKGKYMSLAFRPAEENSDTAKTTPSPAAKASAFASEPAPF